MSVIKNKKKSKNGNSGKSEEKPKSTLTVTGKKPNLTSEPTRERYHHGDLRLAILQSAVKLIESKGEATFSLREIAGSVEVSHAAVYRHFENKRAILAAVAEEGFGKLIISLEKCEIPLEATTEQMIKIQMVNYVKFSIKHSGYFRAMFHHELSDKKDFPGLDKISKQAGTILFCTAQKVRDFKAKSEQELESLALVIWSMMHGLAELTLNRQYPTAMMQDPSAMEKRIDEVAAICALALSKVNLDSLS